jgi:precorrin-2 dehydrogenase/sirohydrochlorin ferrochelatase
MIPLMVDITNKQVIICGGGEVSARKAAYFAQEAEVTVYSRSFSPAFATIPVRKIQIELNANDDQISSIIRGAFLVIAATSDPELNNVIRTRCEAEQILCNSATSPLGDVTLPAQYHGNQFTITVSTHGKSPAVSRYIREYMQNTFPNLDQMICLEETLRCDLKNNQIPEDERKRILTTILNDPHIWSALPSGSDAARRYVQEKYQI